MLRDLKKPLVMPIASNERRNDPRGRASVGQKRSLDHRVALTEARTLSVIVPSRNAQLRFADRFPHRIRGDTRPTRASHRRAKRRQRHQ